MIRTLIVASFLAAALPPVARAQCGDNFVLVTTTDYSTGSTSSLNPVTKATSNDLQLINPDAVARTWGGLVYVVNRAGGDNIQVLDPCNNFNTIHQFSAGNGSNPHDIVFYSPTKAYISRYDMTSVLIMNPQTGATLGTVNLAAFADADGLPEMDQMFLTKDYLCVLLQRLDRNNFYAPTAVSYLVAIDPTTDTVVDMAPGTAGVQPVTLLYTDPYSEVAIGSLIGLDVAYFSTVGYWGLTDGALIRVTLALPTSQGTILTESAAGGDILDAVLVSDTKGFAIVATPSFTTELIAFNPTTGAKIGGSLYAPGGYDLNDIELTPDHATLLLTDRKPTNPGIRCFDVSTSAQVTANPVNVGLPPFDIVVGTPVLTGTGGTPAPATALGANYPNPFNPSTSIPYTLARAGHVTLRIVDVTGRTVATVVDGWRSAGAHTAHWDGRRSGGTPAPSGVYVARLEAAGATGARKLVLMK